MQTEVIGSGQCIWRHAAQLLCRQHLLISLQAERLSTVPTTQSLELEG